MTKVVVEVPNDYQGYQPKKPSMLDDVIDGLISIFVPPPKQHYRIVSKWRRRVDNNSWVKVWEPEQY